MVTGNAGLASTSTATADRGNTPDVLPKATLRNFIVNTVLMELMTTQNGTHDVQNSVGTQ